MVDTALPVWSARGFDMAAGRFRERLDASARPIDVPHRAMVQARQIYVFAHAAQLGWFDRGGVLAETAMASLLREFHEEAGGMASFAFAVGSDGRVVSDVRDAYTHAFVLFAIAWLYRLNGDPALVRLAGSVAAFVDARLFDPADGGMFDAWPVTATEKRQNPLMHLLEAYLALERAIPESGFAERATAIVVLLQKHLFRAEKGVLLEYFAKDWSAHPDPAKASAVEPGHHFEWVWLLREYQAITGAEVGSVAASLYTGARRHGVVSVGYSQLIYDELDDDLVPVKRSHRLWPHTEAIKAAAARHAAGDPDAQPFAAQMARSLTTHFLDRPFAGGWTDQLSPGLAPLVDYVPASSLYHLFFAAAEAERVFGRDAVGAPTDA